MALPVNLAASRSVMHESSSLRDATTATPGNAAPVQAGATGMPVRSYEPKRLRDRLGRFLSLTIAQVLPERSWYGAVVRIVALQAWIGGSSGVGRLDHIDGWMDRLTELRRPFPIPWKAAGLDALPSAETRQGVLYCSAHIPLVRVGIRALIELGHPPTAAIAHPATFAAGSDMLPIWGMTEQVAAIPSGRHALLRARSILRKGGSVSLLTDTKPGGGHSQNAFHLSRRLGAPTIFFFTEVQKDGSILVSFKSPPHPVCPTQESIEINIRWLEKELSRIVARIQS